MSSIGHEDMFEEKENVFYVASPRKDIVAKEKELKAQGVELREIDKSINNTGLHSSGKNKRGPSGTPITPSLGQNVIRRKVDSPRRYLTFENEDIRMIEYENWLLTQRMDRNQETRKFYQLEQEYSK